MLKPFEKILEKQNKFRSRIGVKKVGTPTYIIKGYERYNQKYWVSRQFRGNWDSYIQKLNARGIDISKNLNEQGIPGHMLIDHALKTASGVVARSHHEDAWRWPNFGFLSWSSLTKPAYENLGIESIKISDIKGKNELPMARMIKKISLWFGASLVGITFLNRKWIYSHWYNGRSDPPRNPPILFSDERGYDQYTSPTQLKDGTQVIPKTMKYVIVVAHEENYAALKTAPAPISSANNSNYGYRKVVHIVTPIAEFIRSLGFNAIPTVSDTIMKVPSAVDAGIGEAARHCMLITPEFGPRIRMGAVITDLPLAPDSPISFGIQEFCEVCKICADKCPGKAIPFGSRTFGHEKNDVDAPTISENAGALRWLRNSERCWEYQTSIGGDCGICRRVCPWNKSSGILHTITKWFAIKGGSTIKKFIIKADDFMGYGKRTPPNDWWANLKTM